MQFRRIDAMQPIAMVAEPEGISVGKLNRFGLRDLNDLPKVEDMADALGFEPPLLEDVASTAALPFDAEPGVPEPDVAEGAAGPPDAASDAPVADEEP